MLLPSVLFLRASSRSCENLQMKEKSSVTTHGGVVGSAPVQLFVWIDGWDLSWAQGYAQVVWSSPSDILSRQTQDWNMCSMHLHPRHSSRATIRLGITPAVRHSMNAYKCTQNKMYRTSSRSSVRGQVMVFLFSMRGRSIRCVTSKHSKKSNYHNAC